MTDPIDVAALGRAQTRGEDIRPPKPDYDPIAGVDDLPPLSPAGKMLLALALIGQLEREAER